ncbi:hypothetical protein HEQ72_04350 [Haematospirillum sp. 15-248]|uniref:hypothetical protein n=1 Tax=Haematospirillum sp. 15-248 TaxID=2723107 RepID=UPI00143A2A9A|nr:hypothetical protein [Haematospirillum sp. 15-248]NKD87537.1 hypothetical protein [Haematospirillum sp. 15-248]
MKSDNRLTLSSPDFQVHSASGPTNFFRQEFIALFFTRDSLPIQPQKDATNLQDRQMCRPQQWYATLPLPLFHEKSDTKPI